MAGKVLSLNDINVFPDKLGMDIARKWHEWNTLRRNQIAEWEEARKYVFATDTTSTTNAKLPWKNKTTLPKLCQIRDNLFANYMQRIFPKRKWFIWEADSEDSNSVEKRDSIINYMTWATKQDTFKSEVSKIVLDYIDTGNGFFMPEWIDNRVELEDRQQVGYVGPTIRRISPMDIVFNPIAPSFLKSPKIIKSLISLGELKEMLTRMSSDDNRKEYEEMYTYFKDIRLNAKATPYEVEVKDEYMRVDGFTSWRNYLESDYFEVLTFYGDIYDPHTDEFLRNHVVTVVDRHKVVGKRPNPSFFGFPPIFHVGWRIRQDNLWAMGPLANLVGMQYKIDHLENLQADVLDLIGFPVIKIKGYVEDFDWGPMERIYTGEEGDVDMVVPPYQVLQLDNKIMMYMSSMEELSGSPKEAMGLRSPGEKTAFEVQKLDNASSRIFDNKSSQFEEQGLEPAMNAMLEMARRQIVNVISIPVFNDEFNITKFMELTANDITGSGKIKPVAARHFAEKSEIIQNLTNFLGSPAGQDQGVKVHFSGLKIAKLYEDALDLSDYRIVFPYIRLDEEADAQRLAQQHQENVQMEGQTPAGIKPDDFDPEVDQHFAATQGAPQGSLLGKR